MKLKIPHEDIRVMAVLFLIAFITTEFFFAGGPF